MFVYVESNSAITAFCEDGGITENEHWKSARSAISEPLTEEHGVPIYKLMDGVVTDRTEEEIQADIAAVPEPEPTETEKLYAMLAALLDGRAE